MEVIGVLGLYHGREAILEMEMDFGLCVVEAHYARDNRQIEMMAQMMGAKMVGG